MIPQEDENFCFSNRKEYEDELVRLLKTCSKSKKKKERYEELLEEYLRFCDAGEKNGK